MSTTKLERAIIGVLTEEHASPEDAAAAVINLLSANPALIEDLTARKSIAPVDRSRMIDRANKERFARRERRLQAAGEEIRKALSANPAISLTRLAQWLDNAGVQPQRRTRWDARGVKRIMQELKIERRSSQT